jgi:hypothetical protein
MALSTSFDAVEAFGLAQQLLLVAAHVRCHRALLTTLILLSYIFTCSHKCWLFPRYSANALDSSVRSSRFLKARPSPSSASPTRPVVTSHSTRTTHMSTRLSSVLQKQSLSCDFVLFSLASRHSSPSLFPVLSQQPSQSSTVSTAQKSLSTPSQLSPHAQMVQPRLSSQWLQSSQRQILQLSRSASRRG